MSYRFSLFIASMLVFGAVMAPTAAVAQNELNRGSDQDTQADGRGDRARHVPPRAAQTAPVAGNGIFYHGGPVMLGATHAYYIWYGNWAGNTATSILRDLATNIAPSPYFNINTTYSDGVPNLVSNDVIYMGSTTDNYSRGTALNDNDIQTIVTNAIQPLGTLPIDHNGVYFVLTSADVDETTGFCTNYCGWHTYGVIQSTNIKYSFVGNPDRCPSACEAQSVSPNGNAGADGMASIIAHELEESVTDPELNAWYDTRGNENADKCAWTFGSMYTTGNGALANMRLGTRDFLIQQNWVNASGGYCALSYGTPAPNFSISAGPSPQTVVRGSNVSYTVTVGALNSFAGTVTFSASGLPAGATASFSPASVTTSGNSTLTVTTATSVAAGSYQLTITGTSGPLSHTALVTLVVTTPPTPDFSLSATPASSSVIQGASTTYTATVTPSGGFTGTVTFSASGLPAGAAASFSPASVTTSGNSTLTVTTTSSTPPGTSVITITGTSGSLSHSTTVTLVVNGPNPDFTVSATPPSRTVSRSSSTTYTVTVGAVNGFTGVVNFSVSGLPSRASASFNPTLVTGSGASTMTITVNRKASTGSFPLTITGTSGSLSHSTQVTLSIN